ncbi:MAG: ABC transporter ATP-binding protein [Theionarchaea archaeon]|nr:ABC transporter ATP-binding protein [Theionarchaea archaeon]MBU7000471.1 ABC transporter ATP-binding protein [Theionarchaea archaeon]MBU7020002.1 ABC transporter ATP-binding protein [Theionarchaea archaeon]MBU7035253.1 ABC transporter ATP-binding protein [Theionarchaea archaeon]MBU7040572.1 ABC transporter ATP-binding protein [Theionarchaea archaeon]
MALVEVRNVWVYCDHSPQLEDVSLLVNDHDFLSIIGPNGAGKTTLLKVILGLIQPARGSVTVLDSAPEIGRKQIGYMPQDIQFDSAFPISVFDVVLMGRYKHLLSSYSEKDKKAVMEALKTVEMAKLKDRRIGTLSGGEQQRVFLARALARQPRLLLLDEPTASIDPDARKSFYELLTSLKERMAILLVTHDISVVSVYVDSVACLNRRLYYHGPAEGALKQLEQVYQCPVEVLAHGIPHRVLRRHNNDGDL